jgi:hypothetical protein
MFETTEPTPEQPVYSKVQDADSPAAWQNNPAPMNPTARPNRL